MLPGGKLAQRRGQYKTSIGSHRRPHRSTWYRGIATRCWPVELNEQLGEYGVVDNGNNYC